MSNFIGAVRGVTTGQIYMVINPDSDAELDNPRHLQMQADEPVEMVKVPRGEYVGLMTLDQLAELVERLKS
jgi:hypothetical protein